MSSYTILSGSEHMDVAAIHKFLKDSYWARDISIELVRKSIENSLCYGVFLGTGQVGFARLVTDHATFGYLADVFILKPHRGRGLARRLVDEIMKDPAVQNLRRIMLATADAHDLYRPFGFTSCPDPDRLMQIHRPDMYGKD